MKTPECPKCSGTLLIYISSCMDQECCGLANSIQCQDCYFEKESYDPDQDVLLENWIELGGDETSFIITKNN